MGNQLTTDKLKRIEASDPLPYTPESELEANEIETEVEEVKPVDDDDKDGQISLEL